MALALLCRTTLGKQCRSSGHERLRTRATFTARCRRSTSSPSAEESLDDHSHVHGPDLMRVVEVAVRCPTHAYFESILRMSDRYETGRSRDFGTIVRMTDAALHRLYEVVQEFRPDAAE